MGNVWPTFLALHLTITMPGLLIYSPLMRSTVAMSSNGFVSVYDLRTGEEKVGLSQPRRLEDRRVDENQENLSVLRPTLAPCRNFFVAEESPLFEQ